MLHIKYFTFGPFAENTYLLYNEAKQAIVVDPGMYHAGEDHVLFDFIAQNALEVQQIVNTHCHLDHVFGVYSVKEKYKAPFSFHELEQEVYNWAPAAAERYMLHIGQLPAPTHYLREGDLVQLGSEALEVIFVPGHSPGHICLYHKASSSLIAGDTLFDGSIGRTDLPGGDHDLLLQKIQQQLYTLPSDTKVYSGHGGVTTIGKEKSSNPFVRA